MYTDFLFKCYGDHRDLHELTHSFPTRRASDLYQERLQDRLDRQIASPELKQAYVERNVGTGDALTHLTIPSIEVDVVVVEGTTASALRAGRSEEHTSELQSLMRISYAVFCLKKKKCTVYLCKNQETTMH